MNDDLWILTRWNQGRPDRASFELLARAVEISGGKKKITALAIGNPLQQNDLVRLIACGADQVFTVEEPVEEFDVECFSAILCHLIEEYQPGILIAAADSFGRSVLPYAAMKLRTGLTADCTGLELDSRTGLLLQTRPATGGNVCATIQCANHRPQMATVRPRSCKPNTPDFSRSGQIIRLESKCRSTRRIILESFVPNESGTTLADADKIVAVGRGIRRPEHLAMIRKLADLLGAVLGASRDVVDRGWLPYSCQVGLSGKTVSPQLYVAIGISGAIQHLAGIRTAETIVAINRDPDAPIFKVADFGIVGDLMEIVPAWIDRLAKGQS